MTYEKRNGPAGNRAAAHTSSSMAWTDIDSSAARRRRHEQALRLEPIRCSACGAWHRDPFAHTCPAPEQRLQIIECETHGPFLHCDSDRRAASLTKDAAIAVSQALDWKAVAKRIRDRDEAIKSGAYIPRRWCR